MSFHSTEKSAKKLRKKIVRFHQIKTTKSDLKNFRKNKEKINKIANDNLSEDNNLIMIYIFIVFIYVYTYNLYYVIVCYHYICIIN